jgi:hypothetical protein
MPFAYSCFVSYRHMEFEPGRSSIRRVVDALKGQLEYSAPLPVYLDQERLRGGQFYQEALAKQICESACMVVLYWPTYFSAQHTFCSREFKLMERLEKDRLSLLPERERINGLIIVLALADFDRLPTEIRAKRLCYDFEPYMLSRSLERHPAFLTNMRDIRRYIAERCNVLDFVPPPDPTVDCPQCRLPDTQTILPWLQQVLHPGIPYPTREPGR